LSILRIILIYSFEQINEVFMRILALGGSNSRQSINRQLAHAVAQSLPSTALDLVDLSQIPLPLFGVDIEADGIPQGALDVANKVDQADLIVLSLAEHNGGYSAAFKNLFDWISRIPGRKAWGEKPMILLATSPGARGGASVLESASRTLPHFGAKILGSWSLPKFQEQLQAGEFVGSEAKALIQEVQNKVATL
jgi:chromate reductase